MAKSAAWTRKEGKNPNGGLNAKGRASAKKEGHNLKPPQPEGGSRRDSFCARMSGMKKKLTSAKTAKDPNSRINNQQKPSGMEVLNGQPWCKSNGWWSRSSRRTRRFYGMVPPCCCFDRRHTDNCVDGYSHIRDQHSSKTFK